ncbi:MAG: DUF1540 domain-containing protein [Clostridiales bacterium]|jgi:hypothetical protein|nr:DUF1540 domain-containing protein [Clostridiales bacterium]
MIRCTVKNCKNNDKINHCMLSEVRIGEMSHDTKFKSDTKCDSFEPEF